MPFAKARFPTTATASPTTSTGREIALVVLIHGLLMNRRMYDELAPEIAVARLPGGRPWTCSATGGRTAPRTCSVYSMTAFADQVLALLDHLELEAPVVGGTSLGANVGAGVRLRITRIAAGRCSSRCPCWRTPCSAPRRSSLPVLLGAALRRPALRGRRRLDAPDPAHQLPRRHRPRLDPPATRSPRVAVLEGMLFGRTAPHRGGAP